MTALNVFLPIDGISNLGGCHMLEQMRSVAFWWLDTVRGSQIKRAYDEIKRFYEMDSSSKELEEYHNKALKKLIKHATTTTEFYKKYDTLGYDLSKFPVINKNIIKENQESFLSSKYKDKKLIQMSTSGSTGTPFVSYQNIEKKRRVNAETIFFNGKAGYRVGRRFIFLRSLTDKTDDSFLRQWIQNKKLIDIKHLDKKDIEILLDKIRQANSNKGAVMLAYASTYDAFRDYFKKYGTEKVRDIKLNGLISSSEILYDETREVVSKAFGCKCFSRYANMENGMLGQDDPSHPNTFILNEANYFIEILKENDEPAEEGELGRIVVTDLYNYAMPMIRYDTGDVGSLKYMEINGVKKKVITNFTGRKIDMVYDVGGRCLSPHKVSVTFWSFPEFKQFQFIQKGKTDYLVKINVDGEFNRQDELKEKLLELLGQGANIRIEKVDEIPTLASGKRKYILNKM
jgi:phenylacetate-CoA ligase